MSSLPQLQGIEIDTEKQRQYRCDDVRLTNSRNAKSKQLLMMPIESLTNCKGLPGELFRALECSKAHLVFTYEISDLLQINVCTVMYE